MVSKISIVFKYFFNTTGKLYKELQLEDKVKTISEDEPVSLLSTHDILIKPPLVINNNFILVGFNEEELIKMSIG